MAIVVPSARLAPVEPQQPLADPRRFGIGDAVAAVAGAGAQAAARIDEVETAAAARDARTAAAERLGRLRVEFDQRADWNNLSADYNAAAETARAEIGGDLTPRARRIFDDDFAELRAAHSTALYQREFGLRRAHERARLTQSIDALVNQTAGAPDDASAAAIAGQLADTVEQARDAGVIGPEESARLLAGASGATANGLALRLLREDPDQLRARLHAGDFAALGPERVQRLATSADAEIARRAKATAAVTLAEQKAAAQLLRADVSDAVTLIAAGLPPEGLEELRDRAAGTREGEALEIALRAQLAGDGAFATLTPTRQAQIIKDYRRREARPGDEAVLAAMIDSAEATRASVDADLLGHVAQRGLAEVAPLDLSDPAAVRARVALAEGLAEDWRPASGVRYFTGAEQAQLAQQLRDGDPETQLALAATIVDGFGDRAVDALGELGQTDGVFAHAGALLALSNDDAAARAILRGRALMNAKQAAKPKKAIRDAAIAELAADATASDAEMRRLLLQAADAHFAATGAAADPLDDNATTDAYLASLQAAAGGVTRGGVLFGGLQEVNGVVTILPSDLTASRAEAALAAANAADLAKASLAGAPTYRGKPAEALPAGASLIYDGGGAYLVQVETGDGPRVLADPTAPDGVYRMSLSALAQTVTPRKGFFARQSDAIREALTPAPARPANAPPFDPGPMP